MVENSTRRRTSPAGSDGESLVTDTQVRGSAPCLDVMGLSVEYRPRDEPPCRVLDNVDLSLHAGEAVGLEGPSGTGKTSLLLALMGLLPSSAHVLAGQAVLRRSPGDAPRLADLTRPADLVTWRGHHLGLVFQEPARSLHPLLRVGDQVAEVVRAHHHRGHGRRSRNHARELLAEVGLDGEVGDAYPHQLSGGQCQRVTIAQALAGEPAVLLADEPTAALDPIARRNLIDLLSSLRRRRSMALLWVSHDGDLLRHVTDRQWTLTAGSLSPSGAQAP